MSSVPKCASSTTSRRCGRLPTSRTRRFTEHSAPRADAKMRIAVHAVGRMKAGPKRELANRYLDRFAKAGPALGLDFAGVTEIPESRAQTTAERRREEAVKLHAAMADNAALIVLDERGKNLDSAAFAAHVAQLRDTG